MKAYAIGQRWIYEIASDVWAILPVELLHNWPALCKLVTVSINLLRFMSTNNPKCLRKSAPIMARFTFAIINVYSNRRRKYLSNCLRRIALDPLGLTLHMEVRAITIGRHIASENDCLSVLELFIQGMLIVSRRRARSWNSHHLIYSCRQFIDPFHNVVKWWVRCASSLRLHRINLGHLSNFMNFVCHLRKFL